MKSIWLLALVAFVATAANASLSSETKLTKPINEVLNPEVDPQATDEQERSGWSRVEIPGAFCGDGSKYPVFLKMNPNVQTVGDRSKRLLMILKGGGACWNRSTCNNGIYTKLQAQTKMKGTSAIFSSDKKINPYAHYSKVFFTYCNGDVFLGDHDANYQGKKVKHHGRRNVRKAIRYLTERGLIDLSQAEHFALYGYSAGAVGGLYHAMELDPQLTRATKKVLISDSPGMHFGDTFWDKFSTTMTREYTEAIEATGARIEPGQGNISMAIPSLCAKLDDWTIGVLQGTRDWIMSGIFGDISKKDHARLVLGPNGLYEHTKNPADNCSSWIKDTTKHVFLTTSSGASSTAAGVSAMKYARDLMAIGAGKNHADGKTKRKRRDRRRRR